MKQASPEREALPDEAAIRAAVNDRLANEKLTPMMRQYLTVKSDYPGAIILFRMGDFFETFFDDAAECSRLLDITLTARSKEKDIPMAGVPHHAIDSYLARLIALKKTVVLVDQVEDPKKAKGLVRREVTRVLSPGTYIDSGAPARTAHYLAVIAFRPTRKNAKKPQGWGLSVLDLSTGEFRATAGPDDELLLDELARLQSREIIVQESLRENDRIALLEQELPEATVTYQPDELFKTPALDALRSMFGKNETAGLEKVLAKESLVAAGVALQYATSTQMREEAIDLKGEASLKHIETVQPYVPGEALVLDAQAREHLELFRSAGEGGKRGSLIGAIDEAITAMGGRLLVRWLAYPLCDVASIKNRQDAVEALVRSPSALDALRERIRAVGDLERLVGRVVMGRATPKDLVLLRSTLSAAPELFECARAAALPGSEAPIPAPKKKQTAASKRLEELGATDACSDIAKRIAKALVEDPPADLTSAPVFAEGYDKELDALSNTAKNGKSLIAELEAKERKETGISSLKVRYNRVFGYYIEVTKTNLNLVPKKRYVRKQTTVNSERFYTEELKDLETRVLTAEEKRIERTGELFCKLITKIANEVNRLRALGRALAELDVLAAFAMLAETRSWVRPTVDESGVIEIADGRHPVIELFSEQLGERFVPNDLSINSENHLMIITGPNMAGKSTIMRQTALIAILAHMGSFVPARSAKVGLLDRIFTRVGAADDLSRGRSTFMVEMNETARILRAATERSLILLDEIGRGTSTFDGLSIAWAVAEHLHDRIGAKTLFATHYHELTEICRDKEHATNRHVAVKEWNDEIVFLRKLLPGATNRSYGIQVARLAGLPQRVVERARAVLNSLESQALSAGDRSAVAHLARERASEDNEQLHLFSAPSQAESDPELAEILESMSVLPLDDLTPRQAHEQLAQWQNLLKNKK